MTAIAKFAGLKAPYEYHPLGKVSSTHPSSSADDDFDVDERDAGKEREDSDVNGGTQEAHKSYYSKFYPWLRAFHWTLHIILLVPAVYGLYMQIQTQRGRFVATPIYTDYEIAQAGWIRPALSLPSNSSSRPELANTTAIDTDLQTYDLTSASNTSININDLHVLILTPLRNAASTLPTFFNLINNLDHPKENTSLGFLLGDEEDETGKLMVEWSRKEKEKGTYRRLMLLRKDYGMLSPGGSARHNIWVQSQRR